MIRSPAILLPLIAAFIGTLSSCASVNPIRRQPIVVSTYAFSKSPFFKDRSDTGAIDRHEGKVGVTFPYTYPLMSVRECNSDQTACSVGVVKLHSDTVLQDVSDTGATVLVSVTYDLGRSQVIGDTVMTTREEIPSDVPALKGASHFEKTVTIPLGEMRHLTFDHGVEFGICVAAADQYTLPANGACAMDDILTGKPPKTPISSL